MKILVVEDNPSCQTLARNLLTLAAKHDVVMATTPKEALEAFATHKPALVIMDMALKSGINGIDLTTQFKAAAPEVKILAVSAFQTSFYADDVTKAGADAFLAKPYAPQDFLAKVADLLSNQ